LIVLIEIKRQKLIIKNVLAVASV